MRDEVNILNLAKGDSWLYYDTTGMCSYMSDGETIVVDVYDRHITYSYPNRPMLNRLIDWGYGYGYR